MPTFRNETGKAIDRVVTIWGPKGPKDFWVRFAPDDTEPRGYNFWLPYEELGLTLVDAEDPPVPEQVLVSGTWDFDKGVERKFTIPACGVYTVDVIAQAGGVKLYAGGASVGAEVVKGEKVPFRLRDTYEWKRAPWLRVVGLEDGSRVTLHVEAGPGTRKVEDF